MTGYLLLSLIGLLFGAMIYRYDMHEREPWWMLIAAAVCGAIAMWAAFALEGLFETLLIEGGPNLNYRFTKSFLAGTIEELAKLAVPVAVLLLVRKHFNDPMDGLVYGSLAGLGAAMFEGIWWNVNGPPINPLDPAQAYGPNAMRLVMHTVWGGIGGFALGLIVMKKPWRGTLARYLGLVMLLHFTWDVFIGFAPEQKNLHRFIAAALVGTSIVWYGMLVFRANQWSRSMHAPNSKQRLVGRIVRAIVFRKFR